MDIPRINQLEDKQLDIIEPSVNRSDDEKLKIVWQRVNNLEKKLIDILQILEHQMSMTEKLNEAT